MTEVWGWWICSPSWLWRWFQLIKWCTLNRYTSLKLLLKTHCRHSCSPESYFRLPTTRELFSCPFAHHSLTLFPSPPFSLPIHILLLQPWISFAVSCWALCPHPWTLNLWLQLRLEPLALPFISLRFRPQVLEPKCVDSQTLLSGFLLGTPAGYSPSPYPRVLICKTAVKSAVLFLQDLL